MAAWLKRVPKPDVETLMLEDAKHEQFVLMRVGWHGGKRVKNTVIHARIKGRKIWIEEDWTNATLADQLLKAGVPKEDIVLAFHPPELRHLTEFAPA
jgi:hypothetical protein